MNTMTMKDRIISLLSEVDRKGIDNLIQFIQDSNYTTSARCYSHHKCHQGLMMHSLEVLDCMLKNNLAGIPRESIILVALCHDLGKARLNGRKIGGGDHPSRSISILKKCGVELTKDEKEAILNHHPRGFGQWLGGALKSPLQVLLQMGDCRSTGLNKRGKTYRFSAI